MNLPFSLIKSSLVKKIVTLTSEKAPPLFCDDVPRKSSAALETSQDQHVDRPQKMRAPEAPERKGTLNVDVCGIHWNTTMFEHV